MWVGRMLLHYIEPLVLESCTVQLQLHNHGNENLCHCLCKDCAIATSVGVINVFLRTFCVDNLRIPLLWNADFPEQTAEYLKAAHTAPTQQVPGFG